MDFSSAGYRGGGVPLPSVPARYTVASTEGDATRAIQGAIDAVARLPLDAQGFRGAVALQGGPYRVSGQLRIGASGIVLRGHHTVIVATGLSRRTLIEVAGAGAPELGHGVAVTGLPAPAGIRTLNLASADGLSVGQRILIRRPCTQAWISALGMDQFNGNYKAMRLDWIPGSRDIEWERTIVGLAPPDGGTARGVILDAPITTALESKFGGGRVYPLSWSGRIRNIGIEGLICSSDYDRNRTNDEEHAWICVAIDRAEDVWVRQVTAQHFVSAAVWVGHAARAVTVEDCVNQQPVAEPAAWRRLGFYVGGQQVLVQRCSTEDGRHDFAAGLCAAGPNVFLECRTTRAQTDIGPFESWSSGTLYDEPTIAGAGLAFLNIGPKTQGAGWTSANNWVWNAAAASLLKVEDAPGAPNRIVVNAAVPSLYRAQLKLRLGEAAWMPVAPAGLPVDPPAEVARKGALATTGAEPSSADPALPVAPLAPPPAARALQAVSLSHGYFVVNGRAVFGSSLNSALWKGQLVPGREREVGTSPTRWAPGRFGPGLTEDLDALTDRMVALHASIYWAFPGLWYDRRREEHLITRRDDAEAYGPFFESPWRRTGRGQAWDGLSLYDLNQYNPWYFSRLREMADDCAAKGVLFACQMYCNHNVEEASAHFAEFAWRTANNINDPGFPEPPPFEGASQNRIHIADSFYDTHNPKRRALHERYIRHTLDVLADSPNLMVTLGYQFAGPLPFQQFFIDTVADWSRSHRRHVRVVLQTSKAVTDAILADPLRSAQIDVIDIRYWQYLADGTLFAPDGLGKLAFRELRTNAFGRDAAIPTKPGYVYRQIREYRDRFPDRAIVAGHGGFGPIPVLMAGAAGVVSAEGQAAHDGDARDDAAFLRFAEDYLAQDLPEMKPVDGLVPDAWCLGAEGRAWLVYSPAGKTIRFARSLGLPDAKAVWFDPKTGQTQPASWTGSAEVEKPSNQAWLLWLSAPHRGG